MAIELSTKCSFSSTPLKFGLPSLQTLDALARRRSMANGIRIELYELTDVHVDCERMMMRVLSTAGHLKLVERPGTANSGDVTVRGCLANRRNTGIVASAETERDAENDDSEGDSNDGRCLSQERESEQKEELSRKDAGERNTPCPR